MLLGQIPTCCRYATDICHITVTDICNERCMFINIIHGGHKIQQIRPHTNNFLSLVWNITKLPHRIELAIPKNPIVFVFRFCYILAGK